MTSSLFTASAALTVGLWAHHFSTAQRNGGSALYSLVIVILALSAAVTLSLWTRVVTAIATLVAFDRLILRCEAVLACVLAGVMIAITVASAIWWQAVRANAHWSIQGPRFRSVASPFATNIVLTMLLMSVASGVSILGVARIA
jgi:hypothetical protein